jgi:hypothetical protein
VVVTSFFATLFHSPPPTPLSRYTTWNGVLYLAIGLAVCVWPGVLQAVLQTPPYAGQEEAIMRLAGFLLAVIGWFYVMGARTRADSFGLATFVDRLFVPALLVPLGIRGDLDPRLAFTFSVVDPALGIGALVVWLRTRR